MLKFCKALFLFLALTLVYGLFGTTTVSACSIAINRETPTQTPAQRLDSRVRNSSVILEGTIVATEQRSNGQYDVVVTVKVARYFKGTGSNEVKISGFGGGGGDCRTSVKVGESFFFFATGNSTSELKAYYLFVYDTVLRVNSTTAEEIIKLVGNQPVSPPSPPKLMFVAEPSSFNTISFLGLVFLVSGLVFLLIMFIRNRRHRDSNRP